MTERLAIFPRRLSVLQSNSSFGGIRVLDNRKKIEAVQRIALLAIAGAVAYF
jgi:hypothetical protein